MTHHVPPWEVVWALIFLKKTFDGINMEHSFEFHYKIEVPSVGKQIGPKI